MSPLAIKYFRIIARKPATSRHRDSSTGLVSRVAEEGEEELEERAGRAGQKENGCEVPMKKMRNGRGWSYDHREQALEPLHLRTLTHALQLVEGLEVLGAERVLVDMSSSEQAPQVGQMPVASALSRLTCQQLCSPSVHGRGSRASPDRNRQLLTGW